MSTRFGIIYTAMLKKTTKLQKILVPVELTEASLSAVENAQRLAAGGARIYLMHVVAATPQAPDPPTAGDTIPADVEMLNRSAALENFIRRKLRAPSRFVRVVRCGDPAGEILAFAREERVDAIVLSLGSGRDDETGRAGGTAARVLRHSPVPVLVVKREAARKPAGTRTRDTEERNAMPYDERYLHEIRQKVCRKCIDRTASGLCVNPTFDSCAINRYLPEIIDIVLTAPGDDLGAYVAKLRERVCSICEHQSPGGRCDMREDLECALDRYFPLVIEAVREAGSAQ